MNRKIGLLATVLMGLFLTACAGSSKDGGATPEDTTQVAPRDTSNDPAFGTRYTVDQLAAMGINGNPLNYTTVYFEYNSTNIDQRSEVIALAHARHLATQGGSNVTLEGHADERGTRDYNLALGERRSQAVSSLMNNSGTGGSNISPVSYGEERPANPAHTEAAWQANRRVEISY